MAQSGNFRDRAIFQRATQSYGDYGEQTGSWSDVAMVWADFLETPGREALAAGRLEANKTGTLRVRASDTTRAITGGDRVVIRGETWNILSLPGQVGRHGAVLEFKVTTGDAST